MSDIFHNPAAYDPFFSDTIVVDGVRPFADGTRTVSGTFRACVLDNGYADGFDADAESTVRTFSVQVKAGDWVDETRPQVGDRITLACGVTLAISSVNNLVGDVWTMTAKEVS